MQNLLHTNANLLHTNQALLFDETAATVTGSVGFITPAKNFGFITG
jgi:hypothetical protein